MDGTLFSSSVYPTREDRSSSTALVLRLLFGAAAWKTTINYSIMDLDELLTSNPHPEAPSNPLVEAGSAKAAGFLGVAQFEGGSAAVAQ